MSNHWLESGRGTTPVPEMCDGAGRPARSVPAAQPQDDTKQAQGRATAQAVLPVTSCRVSGKGEVSMKIQTKSAVMLALLKKAEAAATGSSKPIIITGETGTGKTTLARHIHDASPRAGKPFVRICCTNISGSLGESELFGHAARAFTGAGEAKRGGVELADGGTLFLDEIGDLPLELQAKLLDLVDVGTFHPVGSNQTKTVNVRIIVATHCDLDAMVKAKTFREDLFGRLKKIRLHMPALRDRREDMPDLLAACLDGRDISPEVLDVLGFGSYPCNFRELDGVLETAHLEGWDKARAEEEVRRMGTLTPTAPELLDRATVPCEERLSVAARLSEGGAWWSAAELALACGVAKPTLWATLAAWVEDGTLEKKGKASAVRYRMAMHGHASQCDQESAGGVK